MGITFSDVDLDTDQDIVQIAALLPSNKAVIIGNGTAWTAESGSTLRASLGLAIGSDVQAYDADLANWAGVSPSSYLTTSAAALAYQPLDSDLTSWALITRASGFDTFATTPTSANLAALVSDETGTGALVLATSPTLVTPVLGVASATSINKVALTAPATGSTITIADGKTLTASNTLTFTGTDGSTLNVGAGGTLGTAALVADNTLVHLAGVETLGARKHFGAGLVIAGDAGANPGAISAGANYGMVFTPFTNSPVVADFAWLNRAQNVVQMSLNAGAVRFHTYGAGTLVTDSSGNITASSDEALKYITGQFTRGLTDLRAMDKPVSYQWQNEQIELAEVADATIGKLDEELSAEQRRAISLTREETTYTGWTAQGVQKGIPEAIKAGPDGLLNFDERPVLAAMFNALLEMAARIEALEAAQ